jgi:O-antigen ligase
MSAEPLTIRWPVVPGELHLVDALRFAVGVTLLLLVWIGIAPFQSRTSAALLDISEAGNIANQAAYLSMAAAVTALLALSIGFRALSPLRRRSYVLLVAWLCLTSVISGNVDLSIRRLLLTLLVCYLASAMLVLPMSIRQFGAILATAAITILVLCYGGLLLAPELSIHGANDILEPQHAGAWRGLFLHKNGAGAAMAILTYVGLFVAGVSSRSVGGAIAVLAAVFLFNTDAKTSVALMPVVLLLSYAGLHLRRRWSLALITLGPLALICVFTIGSVMVEPVAALVGKLMADPTFTGRTGIWGFAVEHIQQRPWLGSGFQAFWKSAAVQYSTLDTNGPEQLGSEHNSYLDIALTTGVPGLVLTLVCVIVLPVSDCIAGRPARDRASVAFRALCLRLWLFGLYCSCFESTILDRNNDLWFVMLIGLFGLRYLAVQEVVARPPAG